MNNYKLFVSSSPKKKFDVYLNNKKLLSFGASGYKDFTFYPHDQKKKENYIKRHQVLENWNDLNKAGSWSRYILWNKPTLTESMRDMEKRFNIKIS